MILIPVGLAALLRRRFQVAWVLFGIGTLTFTGSQIVHFPLNDLLMDAGILPRAGLMEEGWTLVWTCLVLGLTAGLCEETARAAGYWLLKRTRRYEDGLMLGLGHGGVESMVFGGVLTAATLSSLVPLIGTDLSALNLSTEQAAALALQLESLSGSPLVAAGLPLFERLLAMALHVVLSVLVLKAFQRRNWLYYAGAVVYHMLVDAGAVYTAQVYGGYAASYLALVSGLLPGIAWLAWLWRHEGSPAEARPRSRGLELGAFFAAVRKELVQQWRTYRILVIAAVFILFGLTSPLAARFMPEMIKSIPGAEQFAGLIPTPTTADAMAQYVKNISQFGFILAVLLGMNAVAGEKESGTAAMILSKPMPRWAFVLSKFSAQALVYCGAFAVAGLGAYYYTLVLFGALDPGLFLAINLLLLAWLLTFVGAALLGSVIGSTVAAAAGIGLGLAVAILALGAIPQVSTLMPGGLMNWAAALGALKGDVPANGGALAGALALVVLFLVWAVGLFERQEI